MTIQSYEVLLETTKQSEDCIRVRQWCSDGKVREYSVFEGGLSLGDHKVFIPLWKSVDGKSWKINEMGKEHRYACIAICKRHLLTLNDKKNIAKAKCFIAAFENSLA